MGTYSDYRLYKLDGTRIVSPGKFEGEQRYVPEFWDAVLDGLGTDHTDGSVSVEVTAEDKSKYPELKRRRVVRMIERSDGFVCEV